jgi:ABC-type amino acid transport substrate-binding protein
MVSGVFFPGFIPVPADYTGDGRADACLYDEATGNWYIVGALDSNGNLDGTVVRWPIQHGGYGFAPVKP